ncbi:MAG: DUF493 family protein [Polaribacter sp.]|nr:DUF493 family protein [Polaribacter sp.]
MSDKEAFYSKLKERLNNTTAFPTEYLYKFIVPSTGNQIKEIEGLFKDRLAKITTNISKTGKYTSVSVRVQLTSANEVILYYKKAEKIAGIISL